MPDDKNPIDSFFDFVDNAIDTLDKNLPPKISYHDTEADYIDASEVKITWGLPEAIDVVTAGWHIFDGMSDITLCMKEFNKLRSRYATLPNGYVICCSACLAKLQDAFEKQ